MGHYVQFHQGTAGRKPLKEDQMPKWSRPVFKAPPRNIKADPRPRGNTPPRRLIHGQAAPQQPRPGPKPKEGKS
jgi:hypothetical protein